MAQNIYSLEDVNTLKANPHVLKCSPKSVTYSPAFKVWAVQTYYKEGSGPKTIFKQAGFDLNILGKDKPESCLKRWRRIYKIQGEAGLLREKRGGLGGRKPKARDSSDLEYLNAKVAYLEAENDFLKKLKTKTNT